MRQILACILLMFAFISVSFADTPNAEPSFDAVIVLGDVTDESVNVSREFPQPERLCSVTGTDHAQHIMATIKSSDESIVNTANLPFEVGWRIYLSA